MSKKKIYIYFLISKKGVYSKNYKMQSSTKHIKKKRKKSKNIEEELITKKERAKEQRERITRCESPSPRPIKKGTRKESKQLVIGSI